MEDNVSAELQALTSKRVSLKDKLKKRREAIDSILSQTTAASSPKTLPVKKVAEVSEAKVNK